MRQSGIPAAGPPSDHPCRVPTLTVFADADPIAALRTLHVEDLLLPVLVQLAIIVIVARLFGLLARRVGQPAVVAYEPNTERSSVLSMSVNSVQTGQIQDFATYQLDARTRRSRPYYVRVTAKNVGKGDLSRAAVPLLAVDTRDTLIQPSSSRARPYAWATA